MEGQVRKVSAKVSEIASLISGKVIGNDTAIISGTSNLKYADLGHITFVDNPKYEKQFIESKALVAVCQNDFNAPGKTLILVNDPLLAFIVIVEHFKGKPEPYPLGVDSSAWVSPSAKIGAGTSVLPFARIGNNSIIGTDCIIHGGVSIGRNCTLGNHIVLHPNVVIYDDCVIGNHVTIHANSVIGADGFGYRLTDGVHKKIPQTGNVELENYVEIGAGSTIDRGTFGPTRIGEGTKVDNLVQIGHNCEIGKHNLLVAQVGIAGSCTTGNYVVVAGQAGLADHVTLADEVVVGAKSAVMRTAGKGERLLGIPARQERDEKRILISMARLPGICKDIKKIKKQLNIPDEE
jgi:UDP-3-O-[3-hydroxymyristoyl] glucosamine N-acyltransferase